MRKFLIITLAVALCALGALSIFSQEEEKAPGKGDNFIDFKLKGLDGKTYDTAKLRKGKFSVIELGQTTCPACGYQSKILEELYPKWKKYPLEVLEIYIAERLGVVREYIKNNKTPYAVLVDETDRMARTYRVRFIPVVFVVNPDGKIIYKGNLTERKYFERELIPLLEEERKKQGREA